MPCYDSFEGFGSEPDGYKVSILFDTPYIVGYGEQEKQNATNSMLTVLEFIEALSCSNVSYRPTTKIDEQVNARRIRDGKVPLYETHTLFIETPNKTTKGDSLGGHHRSPRQHLRRGHIRRLPSGRKVWVNSAVIGRSENGVIKKDYAFA
jgi:hypothetical protein